MPNVTRNNADSQWIWLSTIDEVILGTTEVDSVPGGMDNDHDVGVGVEDQPPSQ